MDVQIVFSITGTLYWKPIFSCENLSNANFSTFAYKKKKYRSYSSASFHEEVTQTARLENQTHGYNVIDNASYKVVSTDIEFNNGHDLESSKEISDFLQVTRTASDKINVDEDEDEEGNNECIVGPNSKLELYQLHFKATGIEYSLDAASNTMRDDRKVMINLTVEPIVFFDHFIVKCGEKESDAPRNRVRVLGNASPFDDINHGFNGSYVWLVPVHTTDVGRACTHFEILFQDNGDQGKYNIAKGDGGKYRYIIPINNRQERKKITEVALLRSQNLVDGITDLGYNGYTSDINLGCSNDPLRVVWKSAYTFEI
ncbi:hypothetical protein RUND412_011426 [Rhizina undulata]